MNIIGILASIFGLLLLVVLHELGHFLVAKLSRVKVEEFGVGLPPRLFGVRFGETLYSVNALPIGAFVRMEGEEDGAVVSPRSFRAVSVLKRMCIVIAGVAATWVVAAVILTGILATSGVQTSVQDTYQGVAEVRILGVQSGSPAQQGGIWLGDAVVGIVNPDGSLLEVSGVAQLQQIIRNSADRELVVRVLRDSEQQDAHVVPKTDESTGYGVMGVSLARVATVRSAWYKAPAEGVEMTGRLTVGIVRELSGIVSGIAHKKTVENVEVMGPIGAVQMLKDSFSMGITSYLYLLATLGIYLTLFNLLPIPLLDGGKMVFLAIEGVLSRPVPPRIERIVTMAIGGLLLIPFMLFLFARDIVRIFF